MRIVVTGGAGYIGSHTARALCRKGHEVIIYDNLSTGHASFAKGFRFLVGDIGDKPRLLRALSGADAVMHFAACASVAESVSDPGKYFDNNVRASLCLLDAVRQLRVPYFVFSSSCTVYGRPRATPITEETSCEPINAYGVSKLFFERALEAYQEAHGLRFVSFRYFNAAGADESCEIGELHNPETHLIPIALEVAAGAHPRLQIYGNDYPTRDGTCLRDYVHVNDIADAHLRALDYLLSGGKSGVMNLGTGKGYTVNEVISAVETVTGRVVETVNCPRRPGDVAELVADASRAEMILLWRPSRSLNSIIASAWEWYQGCSAHPAHLEERVKSEFSSANRAGSYG
jgi:UDP-glucose-4-epimerase GalE